MANTLKELIAKILPGAEPGVLPQPKAGDFLAKELNQTQIISVVNQKGGCGKTTTAVNLAAVLAHKGATVLLVDLDPQAHATLGLGIKVEALAKTIYNVMLSQISLHEAVVSTSMPLLDLAPANSLLSGAQVDLINVMGREIVLRNSLKRLIRHYDYIIIDCSPSLNVLTINALTAARWVLVPIQTHYYSLEGMKELFSTLDIVQDRLNSDIEILGILPTLYDSRLKVCRKILDEIREFFKDTVFDTVVRLNVKLLESPMYGKPVICYDPACSGAQAYSQLADEVLIRINNKAPGTAIRNRTIFQGEMLIGE